MTDSAASERPDRARVRGLLETRVAGVPPGALCHAARGRMHARRTRVGDTLGVGSRPCRDRGDSGSSGECLCRQPLPRSRRRWLDPEHERVLEHLHPTRLRGERIPLAARPRRRNGLPVDRREDGLAPLHAPVRRRVRGRPLSTSARGQRSRASRCNGPTRSLPRPAPRPRRTAGRGRMPQPPIRRGGFTTRCRPATCAST